MNTFEVIVRRVGREDGLEIVSTSAPDLMGAIVARNEVVREFRSRGFVGNRNAAGVWRLSMRQNGKRVRLAVFIRPVIAHYSLN